MSKKVMVFGGHGMVGSNIIRRLRKSYSDIVSIGRSECDLINQSSVNELLKSEKPDIIFIAAAKVGGILANATYPANFLYENLMIQNNIIHGAYEREVEKLLFLGSTCIYPRLAPQPIKEESLLTGSLESTNEAYALAKICGLKMCEYYHTQYGCNFISAMPTNLYGYGDNFHPVNSHVIPALMSRFHGAVVDGVDSVTCWGTGSPLREFLFIEDLADAVVYLMEHYNDPQFVNVGSGKEVTIKELTKLIAKVVGFTGAILWNKSKPDGTPRKVTDMSRLHSMGWRHKVSLEDGLKKTYSWYLKEVENGNKQRTYQDGKENR